MITLSNDEIKEILEIALDRDLDEFSMDANWFSEYEMDSLAAVALAVEMQKRYNLRMSEENLPDIQTGTQLQKFLAEYTPEAAQPAAE